MTCVSCGEVPAVVARSHYELCQFCYDCLRHELKTRFDAIRDFGEHHHGNCGPHFLGIFWTGETTLGCGLYLSRTPRQAMAEGLRTAAHNSWTLLRLDIQKTLTDIYVAPEYSKYMTYSRKDPMPYDEVRYGIV